MCFWCTVDCAQFNLGTKHQSAAAKVSDENLQGAKKVNCALLEEAKRAITVISKTLEDVINTKRSNDERSTEIFKQIEHFFGMCMAEMKERELNLKKYLRDAVNIKNVYLNCQATDLQIAKEKALQAIDILTQKNVCPSRMILNNGKAQLDLLGMRNISLQPCEELRIHFEDDNKFLSSIESVGRIKLNSLTPATWRLESTADFWFGSILRTAQSLSPTIRSDSTGYTSDRSSDCRSHSLDSIDCKLRNTVLENNSYQLLANNVKCPSSSGSSCSSLSIDNTMQLPAEGKLDSREFPQNIMVNRTVTELARRHLVWGRDGSGEGEFCRPWGACCDSSGRIIVSDRGNDRIQVFSSQGKFLYEFGGSGSNKGEFCGPTGVAITPDGNVVVVDSNNYRIQIFTIEGAFVSTFGAKGQGHGLFRFPWDCACNSQGQIAVSEFKNMEVQLFSSSGSCLKRFSFYGKPFFNRNITLRGICFTPNDDILVSDYYHRRIICIDKEFKNCHALGSSYTAITYIEGPQGIACDKNGTIFVAETRYGNIKAFSPSGELVWTFGVQGQLPLQFDRPNGICLTPDGRLVIVDFGNARIHLL